MTHQDDIATANFLAGANIAIFENIEALDLVEIRAIAACLPAVFELDSDGKKSAWRERLLARAISLVAQANGDLVKGAWDPTLNRRAMVPLPGLGANVARRKAYFYRTYAESKQR